MLIVRRPASCKLKVAIYDLQCDQKSHFKAICSVVVGACSGAHLYLFSQVRKIELNNTELNRLAY